MRVGGCRLRRLPRSSLGSSNDYDLIWEEEGEETTGTSRREASRAPIVTWSRASHDTEDQAGMCGQGILNRWFVCHVPLLRDVSVIALVIVSASFVSQQQCHPSVTVGPADRNTCLPVQFETELLSIVTTLLYFRTSGRGTFWCIIWVFSNYSTGKFFWAWVCPGTQLLDFLTLNSTDRYLVEISFCNRVLL